MTRQCPHLETLHEGLTILRNGRPAPMPLAATAIAVSIAAGLATISTSRRFVNSEERPVEAVLTLPVAIDAVVTGLRARTDGRELVATALPREGAGDRYEAAIDRGKLAVLHEEALKGVHVLSIGPIAPGQAVEVEIETVAPLGLAGSVPFLRIPVTVGQIYGASPLLPADDLTTSPALRQHAALCVRCDAGIAVLGAGRRLELGETVIVPLDAAIELRIEGGRFGTNSGTSADGRTVSLELAPLGIGAGPLDLAVLVDRSGSTAHPVPGRSGLTIWQSMRAGLRTALFGLSPGDRLSLWQFAETCDSLGEACGPEAAGLLATLDKPGGGTELGPAIEAVLRDGRRDILVLTDGQTWSRTVDDLAGCGARISAILVGPGSLDANIGQLCALTGGQLFHAPGEDVAAALARALTALRHPQGTSDGLCAEGGPHEIRVLRGGVEICARWSETETPDPADAVGRYAAALVLPFLPPDRTEGWAVAHGLCTHRTSLVLTDEAGTTVEALPEMRKIPLYAPAQMAPVAASISTCEAPPPRKNAEDGLRRMLARLSKQRAELVVEQQKPKAGSDRDERSGGMYEPTADTSPPHASIRFGRVGTADAGGIASVDWAAHAMTFMLGDLSALPSRVRSQVTHIARDPQVASLARKAGLRPEVLALALLAEALADRYAQRFVRRVAAKYAEDEWKRMKDRLTSP